MEALNTKRSTCEQAAKKIVYKTLDRKDNLNTTNSYTIQELSKLRSAETEREKEAFQWFIGEFVESVTGQRTWGKLKYTQTVSQAKDLVTGKLAVTVSDEALALLLFDNYSEKWFKQYDDLQNKRRNSDDQTSRNKVPRGTGKFTFRKNGQCEYGGWSKEGIERYNQFWYLVKQSRQLPETESVERNVLQTLKQLCPEAVKDPDVEKDNRKKPHREAGPNSMLGFGGIDWKLS